MGALTVFSINGLKIWFWPKDHNPPHFHVKKDGEWEYRIFFLEDSEGRMFEKKWGRVISKADRKLLKQNVIQHRLAILKEWENKVQQ